MNHFTSTRHLIKKNKPLLLLNDFNVQKSKNKKRILELKRKV